VSIILIICSGLHDVNKVTSGKKVTLLKFIYDLNFNNEYFNYHLHHFTLLLLNSKERLNITLDPSGAIAKICIIPL
jgi:hypothetical protein